MLRVAYHEALEAADADLSKLGVLLVDALHHALKALERGDTALAARIITGADVNADLGRDIEAACVELIWKQQPVASELRSVTAMFEISSDLQRINHYVVDITKHAVRLAEHKARPAWPAVKKVADLAEKSLRGAVDAYRQRDGELAEIVAADDDEFEELYSAGITALQDAIRTDTDVVGPATEMLFVLTSLQRVGEHAASIAWHTEEMMG